MEPCENCPEECHHETFHYCDESGTHCDKHCICTCPDCTAARNDRTIGTALGTSGGTILPGATVVF